MSFPSDLTSGGLTRREWLRRSGGCAVGAGALAQALLAAQPAHAADYKALVCVFLYGGNDGLNTIVPTDSARYNQYAGVRRGLAIPAGSLLRLDGIDFGLHPALSSLVPIWRAGRLAPVLNVGPLQAPLTKAQFRALPATDARIPDNLFSHSDQQILWESSSSKVLTRTGWGGRASEVMNTANPVISVGGNGRFGLAQLQVPLVLPGPGSTFGAYELSDEPWRRQGAAAARAAALRRLYQQATSNRIAGAYMEQQRDAFDTSARLGELVKRQPGDAGTSAGLRAGFGPLTSSGQIRTGLGQQLFQAAKLIESNLLVGGSRQIFFATLGGFDTHGGQIADSATTGHHATLLRELGDALAAFHAAMENIGLGASVTTFTQSDFGRTFLPNNSSGSDHAWGNHHLVLGGAVQGGRTYGRAPELVLGGPDDVGEQSWERQGRWIPAVSVDQYAATLLRWFGANDSQLNAVLPNLVNFGTQRTLGFV